MQTPEEFLNANRFPVPSEIDRNAEIRLFLSEMEAGLRGEASSLLMVNTHIGVSGKVPQGERVIALDAGGTNFRGAVVSIPPKISAKQNRSMPGVKSEVGEEEFYAAFATEVERLKGEEPSSRIGWCFSYPAIATEDGDAKLVAWTKGIKAPSIVGEYVGHELRNRLGYGEIAVVNDTVATLLAAKATEGDNAYSSYIGFILGTGTNCAYVESELGGKIVNAESGAFDKIPQSAFDEAMDAKTLSPGKQIFEKMIAGAYLGPIALEIWKAAAKVGFFTGSAAAKLTGIGALSTMDVDDFCGMVKREGRENEIDSIFVNEADRRMARRLAIPVFERAAILSAIHLAAFAIKSGEGVDESRPIAITVDGSTWYKTVSIDFAAIVKRELDSLLVRRRNIHYVITPEIADAPLIGAGIAALLKK